MTDGRAPGDDQSWNVADMGGPHVSRRSFLVGGGLGAFMWTRPRVSSLIGLRAPWTNPSGGDGAATFSFSDPAITYFGRNGWDLTFVAQVMSLGGASAASPEPTYDWSTIVEGGDVVAPSPNEMAPDDRYFTVRWRGGDVMVTFQAAASIRRIGGTRETVTSAAHRFRITGPVSNPLVVAA